MSDNEPTHVTRTERLIRELETLYVGYSALNEDVLEDLTSRHLDGGRSHAMAVNPCREIRSPTT